MSMTSFSYACSELSKLFYGLLVTAEKISNGVIFNRPYTDWQLADTSTLCLLLGTILGQNDTTLPLDGSHAPWMNHP